MVKRIGYLGPKGTFSQEAAKDYIKDKGNYIECSYSTIAEAILAVQMERLTSRLCPLRILLRVQLM